MWPPASTPAGSPASSSPSVSSSLLPPASSNTASGLAAVVGDGTPRVGDSAAAFDAAAVLGVACVKEEVLVLLRGDECLLVEPGSTYAVLAADPFRFLSASGALLGGATTTAAFVTGDEVAVAVKMTAAGPTFGDARDFDGVYAFLWTVRRSDGPCSAAYAFARLRLRFGFAPPVGGTAVVVVVVVVVVDDDAAAVVLKVAAAVVAREVDDAGVLAAVPPAPAAFSVSVSKFFST